MKKILLAGLLFVSLVGVFKYFNINANSLVGGLLGPLKAGKQELTKKRDFLIKSKVDLVAAHNQLNTQLLNGLDVMIADPVDAYQGGIKLAKEGISNVPDAALKLAGIGDIKSALNAIDDVLGSTKLLLVDIKNRFEVIVVQLDPATDPKGIYRGLDGAMADMDVALNEMATFEKGLLAIQQGLSD
jgi:hypothetical protein